MAKNGKIYLWVLKVSRHFVWQNNYISTWNVPRFWKMYGARSPVYQQKRFAPRTCIRFQTQQQTHHTYIVRFITQNTWDERDVKTMAMEHLRNCWDRLTLNVSKDLSMVEANSAYMPYIYSFCYVYGMWRHMYMCRIRKETPCVYGTFHIRICRIPKEKLSRTACRIPNHCV